MTKQLTKKLNHQFRNTELLNIALTHRSAPGENNERFEFLGDSIVNFVIAEALFERFPNSQEGELSRWRATLINRDTLADLARQFNLGDYFNLGPGELKTHGDKRASTLSCGMEAIIGAIYLDGGFESVKDCILEWYEPLFENLSSAASHKDPKTILQEFLQSTRKPLPIYKIEAIEGAAHKQIFVVSCYLPHIDIKVTGKGSSRRRGEQAAAEAMLPRLDE